MSPRRALAPLLGALLMGLAGACLADESPVPVSPWAADFWRAVSPQQRQYICDHAKMKPGWCETQYDFSVVQGSARDEFYGPLLTGDDVRWLRLISSKAPEALTSEDAAFIKQRAKQTGDPDAMEVLGFLYARGIGVRRNIETAYIWYGRAYLRGRVQVKGNMNILWAELNKRNPAAARRISQLFEEEAKTKNTRSRTASAGP